MSGNSDAFGPSFREGKPDPQLPTNIHREFLTCTGKKKPSVLYIPTATENPEDIDERVQDFTTFYLGIGAGEVNTLRLLTAANRQSDIAARISAADAIYVTGGNTFKMLSVWKRHGIDVMLKKALARGTVMGGHSAGSICWFSYGCSDSFYKSKPFRITAMGIYPGLICPHYDTEPVRQEALKKIMKRTPGLVGIAMDEQTALQIVDDRYRILSTSADAKARKVFWKQGKYFITEIPKTEEYNDLGELLSKP